MKNSLYLLLIALVLISTIPSYAQQSTTVVKIVDGDTLKASYNGQEESIRLIGIDTPESRVNKKTKRDAKRSELGIKTIIAMGQNMGSHRICRICEYGFPHQL